MKIPKKFKMFNHTINVEFVDYLANLNVWGNVNFLKKIIMLDTTIDKNTMEQTFLHELVHLIFEAMNEFELSKNEKLVNTFSELMYQAFETMEF